jgi:nicotinamidase-related amidase
MDNRLDLTDGALLLMDFQNDVVDPAGALGRLGTADLVRGEGGTLDRAGVLLAMFRAAGRPVIHVAVAFRSGYPDADPAVPLSRLCIELGCLLEGSWGAAFVDALKPEGDEPVVVKRGMSAFAGTDLDLLLRLAGVRTLVLAGVASNLVVEATVRQGVDLGYRAVIPADASMGFTPEQHEQSLVVLGRFARVTDVAGVAAAL